jgi:hypothetical protein
MLIRSRTAFVFKIKGEVGKNWKYGDDVETFLGDSYKKSPDHHQISS